MTSRQGTLGPVSPARTATVALMTWPPSPSDTVGRPAYLHSVSTDSDRHLRLRTNNTIAHKQHMLRTGWISDEPALCAWRRQPPKDEQRFFHLCLRLSKTVSCLTETAIAK